MELFCEKQIIGNWHFSEGDIGNGNGKCDSAVQGLTMVRVGTVYLFEEQALVGNMISGHFVVR